MINKTYFLGLTIIALSFNLNSCEKKNSKTTQGIYKSGTTENSSAHVDADHKYEYRTGTSGNYGYNYDVSGDGVEGNVDMQGKYGSGTITDEFGDEKDVEVEWMDYGVMEATDEDGNTYTMEAD